MALTAGLVPCVAFPVCELASLFQIFLVVIVFHLEKWEKSGEYRELLSLFSGCTLFLKIIVILMGGVNGIFPPESKIIR